MPRKESSARIILAEENILTGFHGLLEKLSKYMDYSGVSRDVLDELEESKKSLQENKSHYFQLLTLYTEIKNLLRENNYGLHDQKYEDQITDNASLQLLSEIFFTNEAKQCLNISMRPISDDSEHLFGLSYEDMEYDSSQKKILYQNIQQACIPLIERRLKAKSLSIYKFWNPYSQDSEGLALAKANQLAATLSNEKKTLKELKNNLRDGEQKYKNIFENEYKKISNQIKELEEKVCHIHNKPNVETAQITVDWLAAKCDYILTKIIVMKNHLYDETYTGETIEALSKIRMHVEEEIQRTQKELDKTKQSLRMYESIGDQFTDLLNQYRKITIQIDNKKWALSELQKNKSFS